MRLEPRLGKVTGQEAWYVLYALGRRSRRTSTQTANRRVAERRLREFIDLYEAGKIGLDFSFRKLEQDRLDAERAEWQREREERRRLSLDHLLAVYEEVHARGEINRNGDRRDNKSATTKEVMAQLRRVLAGIAFADEITPEGVLKWGEKFVAGGRRAANTRRHHEASAKAFTSWLARTGKLDRDPLAGFRRTDAPKDTRKRTRHAFSADEFVRLLRATLEGGKHLGMTARQRWLLYRFAAETGFRLAECAAVRRDDFAEDFSSVHIAPWASKNYKAEDQPLPSWLRQDLADYVAGLEGENPWLWQGGWTRNEAGKWAEAGWVLNKYGSKLLRPDAERAGIKIGQKHKAANGGRVLDFHSLRHVFGVSLRGLEKSVQMRLLRTNSEKIWETYCHPDDVDDLRDRIKAIDSRRRIA